MDKIDGDVLEAIIADTAKGLVVWSQPETGAYDHPLYAVWRGLPVKVRYHHMTSDSYWSLMVNGVPMERLTGQQISALERARIEAIRGALLGGQRSAK